MREREVTPTIVSLQEQLEQIRTAEIERVKNKLGALTPQQQEALTAKPGSPEDPFSLAALLKRHDYVSNDEHIRTIDQLRRHDKTE